MYVWFVLLGRAELMGGPVLVTDAEIVEAGERIIPAEPVNETQLWGACG